MTLPLFSPLEQFEIIFILPLADFAFTNSSLVIFFIFGAMMYFFFHIQMSSYFVLKRWQLIGNHLYNFVKNLIVENIGSQFSSLFVLLFMLFFFLLIANLFGMVPYSFTITSHLILTLSLSFAFFFGINIIGLRKHGFEFLGLFLPSGAPLVIAPFLILIELISYIARVFSLAIRLFANMMSGHTLLNILAGFGWTMLTSASAIKLLFFIPTVIVFAVTGLEVAIAALQAYVFSVLVCIYLNDVIALH